MNNLDYLTKNREAWNQKAPVHINSDFYDNESFLKGRNTLNSIELELLGDMKGKSVLHLQCHFGQDTISLSRLGAKVTGVDFSDKAIDSARKFAVACSTDTQFIISDILSLKEKHNDKYDYVFASYGTIGWLPDIELWAKTIAHFLKEGGIFVFAEFHPAVWMFDNEFNNITYNYFKDDAIIEKEESTYADKSSALPTETISWNHSLSSVIMALQNEGINIEVFNEFDYSPYDCFDQMIEIDEGKYQIQKFQNKLPLVYSLKGKKL